MDIPQDIINKIEELFPLKENSIQAIELISGIWKIDLNVGQAQLARSILILSDGKIELIRKIIDSNFNGDPRDIIMAAEQKMGNPGHYFISPFNGE